MLTKWTLDIPDEICNKIQMWANFPSYFAKGSQKKVAHHLERVHIDSKICSRLLGATRTRIQPVLKLLRRFAHFVSRYSSVDCLLEVLWGSSTFNPLLFWPARSSLDLKSLCSSLLDLRHSLSSLSLFSISIQSFRSPFPFLGNPKYWTLSCNTDHIFDDM